MHLKTVLIEHNSIENLEIRECIEVNVSAVVWFFALYCNKHSHNEINVNEVDDATNRKDLCLRYNFMSP